jgi:hypothetical protein
MSNDLKTCKSRSFLRQSLSPELCPGTNVFTPKGFLLVAQRELFEALFSNPSRARHDII